MGKAGRGDATNAVGARQIVVHGAAGERDRPRTCPRDVASDTPRATVELQRRSGRYGVVASVRRRSSISVAPVKTQQATVGPDCDRAA